MYLKIIQTLFSKAWPQGSLVQLAANVITFWHESQRQCSETGLHKLYGQVRGRLSCSEEFASTQTPFCWNLHKKETFERNVWLSGVFPIKRLWQFYIYKSFVSIVCVCVCGCVVSISAHHLLNRQCRKCIHPNEHLIYKELHLLTTNQTQKQLAMRPLCIQSTD